MRPGLMTIKVMIREVKLTWGLMGAMKSELMRMRMTLVTMMTLTSTRPPTFDGRTSDDRCVNLFLF